MKGSGQSIRPPFTAACAPPRIAAPASGSRITHAAQLRGGPEPPAVNAITPSTIAAVPAVAADEGGSPRKSIAPSTAKSGVVLEIVPATVGPVKRFDAKLRKVTSAGKISPTAAKIANAVAFQPSPRKRNSASSQKSSVVEGMLTSAPRAGSRKRRPTFAITTAVPRNAEATSASAVLRSITPLRCFRIRTLAVTHVRFVHVLEQHVALRLISLLRVGARKGIERV